MITKIKTITNKKIVVALLGIVLITLVGFLLIHRNAVSAYAWDDVFEIEEKYEYVHYDYFYENHTGFSLCGMRVVQIICGMVIIVHIRLFQEWLLIM